MFAPIPTNRCLGLLTAILVAGAIAYWPGMQGGFVFDDIPNIVQNERITAVDGLRPGDLAGATFSGQSGPLGRPLSMASLALNYLAGGLDPAGYKFFNLALHLLNALLVFLFVRAVLGTPVMASYPALRDQAEPIALVTTALWVLHPVNLTTVLLVVQRMTGLSAFFTLLALLLYLHARRRLMSGSGGVLSLLVGVPFLTGVAVLAKENAVLVPLYAGVCELVLFPHHARNPTERRSVALFFSLFLLLPVVLMAGYLALNPDWLSTRYAIRDFTLTERLWTESRVLWFYVSLLLLPGSARLGIFHDHIAISRGWFDPASTTLAVIALIAVLAAGLLGRRRAPVVAFAVLWFLAGHTLESTIVPLEIAHEHRNYVPGVAVLMAVAWALVAMLPLVLKSRAVVAIGFVYIAVIGTVTFVRADQWRDPLSLAAVEVSHHPGSSRAQYELAYRHLIGHEADRDPSHLDAAEMRLGLAADLAPTNPGPAFALVTLAAYRGVEPSEEVLVQASERLRTSPLHPGIASSFEGINKCMEQARCAVLPEAMIRLYGAILQNPRLAGTTRANVLTQLGRFYANSLRDPAAALRVMRDVADNYSTGFDYRANLIEMLIHIGESDVALDEIARARAQSSWDGSFLKEPFRVRRLEELERRAGSG